MRSINTFYWSAIDSLLIAFYLLSGLRTRIHRNLQTRTSDRSSSGVSLVSHQCGCFHSQRFNSVRMIVCDEECSPVENLHSSLGFSKVPIETDIWAYLPFGLNFRTNPAYQKWACVNKERKRERELYKWPALCSRLTDQRSSHSNTLKQFV